MSDTTPDSSDSLPDDFFSSLPPEAREMLAGRPDIKLRVENVLTSGKEMLSTAEAVKGVQFSRLAKVVYSSGQMCTMLGMLLERAGCPSSTHVVIAEVVSDMQGSMMDVIMQMSGLSGEDCLEAVKLGQRLTEMSNISAGPTSGASS